MNVLPALGLLFCACSGASGSTSNLLGTTPASAGTAGNAGTLGSGGSSADAVTVDYSVWTLQLPTGSGASPTTISPTELLAGYSDAYFYPAPDGGRIYMDPATGITTPGSVHCRTEMRESTPSGAQAAWPARAINSLTVSGKVLLLGGGASGRVTVGQIFNGTDSIPLCELEYVSKLGGFQLLYEETKAGGATTDLHTPVALNSPYGFTLALSNGLLTVSINGKLVYGHTPSPAVATKSFYFKFGNYDQTATSGAIDTTPYTIVENYSVRVVHE